MDALRNELANYIPWILAFHIIAVIAFMSGMLYLPRLFVYHMRAEPGSAMDKTFQEMEFKLYRYIMTPALIVAFLLGCCLIWFDAHIRGVRFLGSPWMSTKLTALILLFAYHGFLGRSRRAFAANANTRSERFWRISNEIPFLLAIIIVLAVTTKFGGG
jgi:protoporphyrinogen IX oxidase